MTVVKGTAPTTIRKKAGVIRNKPRENKKIADSVKRINDAFRAKTSYLSEEFKAKLNQVSGVAEANKDPIRGRFLFR
jgi:phage host-nuclease inhibitor protein Gam